MVSGNSGHGGCGYGSNSIDYGTSRNARAAHLLSTTEKIFDLGANLWEWVDWSVEVEGLQGIPNTGCESTSWTDLPNLNCSNLEDTEYNTENGTYDRTQGTGAIFLGDGVTAVRRSTYYNRKANAGIYEIFINNDFDSPHSSTGLRCVFRP